MKTRKIAIRKAGPVRLTNNVCINYGGAVV